MKQLKAHFYKKAVNIDDIRERTAEEWSALMDKAGITEEGQKKLQQLIIKEPKATAYAISKIILLTARQYDKFARNLLKDQDFIKENKELMHYSNDTYHCLAVTCKSRDWVILVESEGYDYARYTAKIPKGEA